MPDGKGTYSIEEIKSGIDRFYKENKRYPTAPDIDSCPYLPSARQIQRNFGGLEKLRKNLGYKDIHFGKGKFRSVIASRGNKIGFQKERELEKILIDLFGEPFVHIEKPLDSIGRQRLDFFIYTKKENFGVDVFYSKTKKDIQKNINIKLNNYKRERDLKIYFVLANDDFIQDELDQIRSNKTEKMIPNNILLFSWKYFLREMDVLKEQKITLY